MKKKKNNSCSPIVIFLYFSGLFILLVLTGSSFYESYQVHEDLYKLVKTLNNSVVILPESSVNNLKKDDFVIK